jgi:hypothetical protein
VGRGTKSLLIFMVVIFVMALDYKVRGLCAVSYIFPLINVGGAALAMTNIPDASVWSNVSDIARRVGYVDEVMASLSLGTSWITRKN